MSSVKGDLKTTVPRDVPARPEMGPVLKKSMFSGPMGFVPGFVLFHRR